MRLFEAKGQPLTLDELQRTTRLGPVTVERAAKDLVTAHLAAHDAAAGTYSFVVSNAADRDTVTELAALYHQRPVTLVRLVYAQPPSPVKSFADAFRLRHDPEDK